MQYNFSKIWTAPLLIVSINTSLFAQYSTEQFENQKTVPVAIRVESASYQEPVHHANIKVMMRDDSYGRCPPNDEFIGNFITDETGTTVLSLEEGKSYIITTSKEHYRTQIAKLPTTDFSRTTINTVGISLSIADLFLIKGKVVLDEGQTNVDGVVTIVNTTTGHRREVKIHDDGTYEVPSVMGENYELLVEAQGGMLNEKIIITKEEQMGNYEVQSFNISSPVNKEFPKSFDYDLLMVDVAFKGKSASIVDMAEVDTLCQVLSHQPDLQLEIELHTDAKRSSRLNYLLTIKRAQVLASELRKRKVDINRVTFTPKGEEEIINHCKNGVECSKQEHLSNDRLILLPQ